MRIVAKDKMVIEVNCKFRNNVGACETCAGSYSFHCLHCPLGYEWIKEHVKIMAEDTVLWGRDAEEMLKGCNQRDVGKADKKGGASCKSESS